MNRHFLILAAILSMTAGCVARPADPLVARRHGYERLLSFIEPGMSRRQLYALLPPRRTPTALPHMVYNNFYAGNYAYHGEAHPLDRDFSLYVQYRHANRREYPSGFGEVQVGNAIFGPGPEPKPIPSKQNLDDEIATPPILRGPTVPYARTVIQDSTGSAERLAQKAPASICPERN